MTSDLAPPLAALQQSRAPRPLPLFLALVRQAGLRDPELARAALAGLRLYGEAPLSPARPTRREIARIGGATLHDCGGAGATLAVVPSLINPPTVLDLDSRCSLVGALATRRRVLLLDWGPANERSGLDLGGHIDRLLLPLLQTLGPVILVGYCLGGTLALLAGQRAPDQIRGIVTLAAPWRFDAYPAAARDRLQTLWQASEPSSEQLGGLPMEVLQAAFWALDPARVVAKFARFAREVPGSVQARRFVALEEWANGGEPLPLPAARELVNSWFCAATGSPGRLPDLPMLHVTATADDIVPAETAAEVGDRLRCPAGHVGMIVGRNAPTLLHEPLQRWLEGVQKRG